MASIRSLIPALLSLQLTIAVGVTGVFSFLNGQRAVYKLASQGVSLNSERIEQHIDSYLKLPSLIADIVTTDILTGQLNPGDLDKSIDYVQGELKELIRSTYIYYGNETGFFIGLDQRQEGQSLLLIKPSAQAPRSEFPLNAEGKIDGAPTQISEYDPRQRPWYIKAKTTGKPGWGPVYVSASDRNLTITYAIPVFARNAPNRLEGVVGLDVSLKQISQFLKEQTNRLPFQAFIVDRQGKIVATCNPSIPYISNTSTPAQINAQDSPDPILRAVALGVQENFGGFSNLAGDGLDQQLKVMVNDEPMLINLSLVKLTNNMEWVIITAIPESTFMSEIEKNTHTTIGIIVITLILNIILGMLIARWLLRPVDKLNQAAVSIESGEFAPDMLERLIDRKDEMGQMARVFQRMGSTVIAREQELKDSLQTLQAENEKVKQTVAATRLGRGVDVQGLLTKARQTRLNVHKQPTSSAELRKISYLRGMNDEHLTKLLKFAQQTEVKQGEYICHEEEAGGEFCIILQGQVEIISQGTVVTQLGPGDYFGEVSLLLDLPRMASVRCAQDTQLLLFAKAGLQLLLHESPELSDRIFTSLSDRRADINQRQANVQQPDSRGFWHWLKNILGGKQ